MLKDSRGRPGETFSTTHIDYLQRTGMVPEALSSGVKATSAPVDRRRCFRIRGIGRLEKHVKPTPDNSGQFVFRSEDVIVGLYGQKIPLAFLLKGSPSDLEIYFCTWTSAASQRANESFDRDHAVLKGTLSSLYPAIHLEDVAAGEIRLDGLTRGGFVLGHPTGKPPDLSDGAHPIDRLVRSLSGSTWAALILAQPIKEDAIAVLRNAMINETRMVASSVQATQAPSPLSDLYMDLLKPGAAGLTWAQAVGGWRTAVYLLGTEDSYHHLTGVWRSIFAGEASLPEPIRVWPDAYVTKLVEEWAMPDEAEHTGPGSYHHPLRYQTMLTSDQLAAYVHLPQLETRGFSVKMVPGFDVVPPTVSAEHAPIRLGRVVPRDVFPKDQPQKGDYEQLQEIYYPVSLKALTKHVFIPGVTGSGKTTTIFHLLKQAAASNVPFLVIEPAKTEYRELLNHSEIGTKLRVFTVGNEKVSPLRLNPFEALPGTPISVHIDLLRSVFSASFGLWTPLPQILEECLHLAYQDRGWNVAGDFNYRTDDRSDPMVFPTLSDLLHKIDEVMSRSVWDREATGRIRGALQDRMKSLRNGAKGRMLDVQRSLSMEAMLEHPTVIELEGLGDDDDKAFMMGLLLIRLVEYRRGSKNTSAGNKHGLRHLLVFEEAHRLLSNVTSKGEEGAANPRVKAVESFANLLSEVRAYGQGVIIADQVPVKLAPDVIKNTNLKIAHRVVDSDDRKVLAGSMAMTDQQAVALATLLPGRAAVFSEGDDEPLLVHVPAGPDPKPTRPDDSQLTTHMRSSGVISDYQTLLLPHARCTDTGEQGGAACEAARAIVEDPVFRRDLVRLVLSLIDDESALERLWPSIERHVAANLRAGIDRKILTQCTMARAADWFASRRGAQASWPYSETADLSAKLLEVLSANGDGKKSAKPISFLRASWIALHKRSSSPYSHCEQICNQEAPLCLYRHAVEDTIGKGEFTQRWNDSNPLNLQSGAAAWAICQRVAEQLVEWNPKQESVIRRIGLCYGQKMLLASAEMMSPEYGARVMESLSREAEATQPSWE